MQLVKRNVLCDICDCDDRQDGYSIVFGIDCFNLCSKCMGDLMVLINDKTKP